MSVLDIETYISEQRNSVDRDTETVARIKRMLSYSTLKVDNLSDLDKILIYLKRKRKTFIISL